MTDEPRQANPPDPVAVGCAGIGGFFITIVVVGLVVALSGALSNPVYGWAVFLVCAGGMVALFFNRKRRGPSPELTALAIGAAFALVVVGTCLSSAR